MVGVVGNNCGEDDESPTPRPPFNWKSMEGEIPAKNLKAGVSPEGRSLELLEEEEEEEDLSFLVFRQPPPMGTFLKAPPLVQYLRHVLQK